MPDNSILNKSFYANVYPNLSFLDTVKLSATGDDTVNLITKTINTYSNSDYVREVVRILSYEPKPDKLEFSRRLFEVCCLLVKYRRDPAGHEIVFTPQMLMKVREGDCKKFTTFICAVLKCAGINAASKVVTYQDGYDWQHIYAIMFYPNAKGYITLDPVNKKKYDSEVWFRIGRVNFFNYTFSKKIMNKLSLMGNLPDDFIGGIGDAAGAILDDIGGVKDTEIYRRLINSNTMAGIADDYINGIDDFESIGKRRAASPQKAAQKAARKEKRKAVVKKFKKKVFAVAKKSGFTPVRVAFLALIAAGRLTAKTPLKFNLADSLAKLWVSDNGRKLSELWLKFGGQPMALKKAIAKAAKRNISGIGYDEYQIEGIGAVSLAALVSAVTAAAPLLMQILKILKENKIVPEQAVEDITEAVEMAEEKVVLDSVEKTGEQPEATKVLQQAVTQNQELIRKMVKEDNGGDRQAIKTITQTQTPVEQEVFKEEGKSEEESETLATNITPVPKGFTFADLKNPHKYLYPGMITLAWGMSIENTLFNQIVASAGLAMMAISPVSLFVESIKNKVKNVKI